MTLTLNSLFTLSLCSLNLNIFLKVSTLAYTMFFWLFFFLNECNLFSVVLVI